MRFINSKSAIYVYDHTIMIKDSPIASIKKLKMMEYLAATSKDKSL